jgi:LexA-binding, inner membrane-associated putative hydrolase
MASPVAHVAVGWSLALLCRPRRIRWQDAAAAAVLTVLPDFDLLAIPFVGAAEGHYWHHTVTHSAGFVLLAGLVAAAVSRIRRGQTAWGEAALVAMLIGSHTVVDYYTVDRSLPIGVPLWWPLSVEFYEAPHPVFLNIERGGLWNVLGPHNVQAMLREVVLTLPLLGLCFGFYRWRGSRS